VKGGRGNNDERTHPRLTVVQGTEQADPAALDDVLEMLVTWAIRAHDAGCSATDESVNCDNNRSCDVSN